MESERDELDRLIDTALATYSEAEPLAGLEQRVLERVRLAETRRRVWAWLNWSAAVAALAVVLFMVNRPRPVEHKQPQLVGQAFSLPSAFQPARRAEARRQARRPAPRRPDQFPTPTPLTAEERALLTLARLDMNTTDPKPIEIEPIEIAPLRITEDQ